MKENVKVAVVGSGVAGLGAAWHLCSNPGYEVTVFEAEDNPGGHSSTVKVPVEDGTIIDADVGFIVFNKVIIFLFEFAVFVANTAAITVDSGANFFPAQASGW